MEVKDSRILEITVLCGQAGSEGALRGWKILDFGFPDISIHKFCLLKLI